jgi:hypothetical protein
VRQHCVQPQARITLGVFFLVIRAVLSPNILASRQAFSCQQRPKILLHKNFAAIRQKPADNFAPLICGNSRQETFDLAQKLLSRRLLVLPQASELVPMTSHECRAKALECYRIAQKAADPETRHSLLNLAVQWRELAIKMDRLNKDVSHPLPHSREFDPV